MQTKSTESRGSSRRLSAIHDLLLDIATALGALREHGRLTDARLDRNDVRMDQHGQRLASAEVSIVSHQQVISMWKQSTPSPPPFSPTPTTQTSANSTATSPTDTATAPAIWRRAFRAFTKEGLKELIPSIAGRIGSILLPYLVPAALAVLAYVTPFGRALWRLIVGAG